MSTLYISQISRSDLVIICPVYGNTFPHMMQVVVMRWPSAYLSSFLKWERRVSDGSPSVPPLDLGKLKELAK